MAICPASSRTSCKLSLCDRHALHGRYAPDHTSHTPRPRSTAESPVPARQRSEEHTSELQSLTNLVCRLLLEKKKILYAPRPEVSTRACISDKQTRSRSKARSPC